MKPRASEYEQGLEHDGMMLQASLKATNKLPIVELGLADEPRGDAQPA